MTLTYKSFGALLCVLVLAASAGAIFYHLTAEPLQDYDEATYTEVVHEALVNRDYLTFTYAGVPDFKKPPLMFWSMLASERVLGENLFSERLPFVIVGLLLIAAVMLVVYEASGDLWAAALGGAVLATTTPFLMTAREVRMDAPVALFITLALLCAYKAVANSRWWVGFGIALGLAMLAKSVIAVFAVVAALVLIVLYNRYKIFKDKNVYWGVLAFFIVAAPWHLYEWVKFGNAFWTSYLGQEVIERTEVNLFWTVTLTNADYIHFAQMFVWPWLTVFCIVGLCTLVLWKWVPRSNKKVALASAVTIAAMIAVFFWSVTKAPTYLIPTYPLMAIVIALGFASIKNKYVYLGAGAALLVLVMLAGQFALYNAYYQNPYFNNVRDMARDEYAIAAHIKDLPTIEPVYAYHNDNLGTIKYYSRHFYFLPLGAGELPAGGAYVLVNTADIPNWYKTFPNISTQMVYSGPQVTLLGVLSED